ncbi:MAG: hypothetical protein R8P61_08735 [Bacteroidia bacterium]|nr:hypothetical protein [Bacteroidia bacterium]
MKPKTPPKALFYLMIFSGILQLFGCIGRNKSESIEYPPFTIKRTHVYKSRFDINTARRTDDSRTHYQIYYNEQLIPFPDGRESQSGLAGIWKVHPLPGTPKPALLVGNRSVYLLTADNNGYHLQTIEEEKSDFASWQWIDSEDGHPSEKQEIYASDDTDKDWELSGGTRLLINKKFVLALGDLSITPFDQNALYIDEFSPGRLIGSSPDKEQLVFMSSKYRGFYQYALLVYNYPKREAKLLPFDRNETRLHEPHHPPANWLTTYFEWKEESDRNLNLEKRHWDKLPYWEGDFSSSDAYSLSPVTYEFLGVFADFCKDYLTLDDSTFVKSYYGEKEEYDLKLGDNRIEISFLDNVNTVYLSTSLLDEDEKGSIEIIRKLGNAFNKKLRAGAYQEYFTHY